MEEGLSLLRWLVPPREAVEDLDQADGEEWITLEAFLPAEEMQFDKQLIDHSAIERADHVGEGSVEGTLAVGNGESCAHAIL